MISQEETLEMMYGEKNRKASQEESLKTADLMDLQQCKISTSDTRPAWDAWFMSLAFVIAQRSLDKHTKHGCVVVDDSRTILSVGYNGPPRDCIDEKIPLERPAKYMFMEHSESNAITNAARSGVCLKGSTFYITGPPCNDCFRKILNVGATRIVRGPILHKRTIEQERAIEIMNLRQEANYSSSLTHAIEIEEFVDLNPILKTLKDTQLYIGAKLQEQRKEDGKEDSTSSSG